MSGFASGYGEGFAIVQRRLWTCCTHSMQKTALRGQHFGQWANSQWPCTRSSLGALRLVVSGPIKGQHRLVCRVVPHEKAVHQFCAVILLFFGPEHISDCQKDSGSVCWLRGVHILACFWEKQTLSSQSQNSKRPSRLWWATDANVNICHGLGSGRANGTSDWQVCAKVPTFDIEAYIWTWSTETYAVIMMMSFIVSLWLLDQVSFCMCYNSIVS